MTEEKEENQEDFESQVKILRLTTGEDIVALCLFDDESVTVDNPMKVYINRNAEAGKTMLIMLPWLPLEIVQDEYAHISLNDIITVIEPKESFVEYYFDTVSRYQVLIEKQEREVQADDVLEDQEDLDDEAIEEILEILKERKKYSIH
jgi:hypothetical protein